MSLSENLVLLRNKESKTVYSRIMTFLGDKSELTRRAYEDDIRGFFKTVVGKEIELLVPSDLTSFDEDDVLAYKNALKEVYSAGTVNRKLSSMRSLYKKLSGNRELRELGVDMNVFNTENVKGEVNGYGSLTWNEVSDMIERVKRHPNGLTKSLIVELAAKTGFRIESVLSVKWSNFYYDEEHDLWIVKIVGKFDKEDKKPIKPEFYNRLLSVRKDSDNLFDVTSQTMRLAIKKLCEEMQIDPRRNITFHSLKKMGVNKILKETGDVKAAQRYANHTNAATTLNAYAEMNNDLSEMPSLQFGETVDITILESLTKEDLLRLIANSSEEVKHRLVRDAQTSKF